MKVKDIVEKICCENERKEQAEKVQKRFWQGIFNDVFAEIEKAQKKLDQEVQYARS